MLKSRKIRGGALELKSGQYQTKSGLFSISDKIDNLGIRLSLENQESKGFHYDTDFKKFTSTPNSSLDIPDGEFNINLGYQEKEFGAYDFYTPGLGYPSKEWTKTCLYKYGQNYIKHLVNTNCIFSLPFGIQTIGFSYKKKPIRRGWFLLNTHLSYQVKPKFQVFFNVTNLLNVEYQEIEGIPQPGRWVEAGLRLEW